MGCGGIMGMIPPGTNGAVTGDHLVPTLLPGLVPEGAAVIPLGWLNGCGGRYVGPRGTVSDPGGSGL